MATLIYIHGFLSSPLSYKAQAVRHWLAEHRPDINYSCPALTPYPDEVKQALVQLLEQAREHGPVYAMGSSMGGFWATYLTETYDIPSVLINPAVDVANLFPCYLDVPLQNYHTEARYRLAPHHLEQLTGFDYPEPKRNHRYWLFAQTGDETLDYQLAVNKYRGSRQTVEEGGDHSFQGFERWIPKCIDFFEAANQ